MASYNPNLPVDGNPFLDIPSDMDSSPFRLVWEDICSVPRLSRLVPFILLPLHPLQSGPLDELYPNAPNARDVALHAILVISQVLLILSLPIAIVTLWAFPFVVHVAFYACFTLVTLIVARLLNGPPSGKSLIGVPKTRQPVNDESELWFFINGIATGEHWHQSNLDALAETFGREIVGIHNATKGLILDLVECLIQRDLDYKNIVIRQGRAQLRAALAAPATKKVVLVAHSQGGIIASSIIDWLFGELSYKQMRKLEVYTFASAARNFRNPPARGALVAPDEERENHSGRNAQLGIPRRQGHAERVIRYIEHYANTKDFVANIGVLEFTTPVAAYSNGSLFSGSVFVRKGGSGHLFNMHYLDPMFGEQSSFMRTMVESPAEVDGPEKVVLRPVSELSRLYQYKNGESPEGPGEVVGVIAKAVVED